MVPNTVGCAGTAPAAAAAATPDKAPNVYEQQQPPPAAAALTPLQLRQWQRAAQRSVRMAVTAFKAGRTKIQGATDQGTAAATQLTNSVLTAQYLPAMQLPEPLKGVQGLRAAAVSKLQRRQQQHLQELVQAVEHVAAAVTAMELALADIKAQLGEQQHRQQQQAAAPAVLSSPGIAAAAASAAADAGGSISETAATACTPTASAAAAPQTHTAAGSGTAGPAAVSYTPSAPAASSSPSTPAGPPAGVAPMAPRGPQCSRMAVFHLLTLPEAAGLLEQVLHMHQQDLASKQQVLEAFTVTLQQEGGAGAGGAGHGQLSHSSSGSGTRKGAAGDAAEGLRRRLTVLITCWMTKPYVEDDEASRLLQLLTDEMTGF